MDIIKVLSSLTEAQGVSGCEDNKSHIAAKYLEKYGETTVDHFNNVICKAGSFSDSKPICMLDAHIDEIGMIVTSVCENGFLKVAKCGGVDSRVLLAQEVTIYGREVCKGYITSTPPHLQKDNSKAVDVEDIYIDTGYSTDKARKLFACGDRVLIENKLAALLGDEVTAKSLDDCSGVVAILLALEKIQGRQTAYNIAISFSSQEETGERGAKTSAYKINPDVAIAVDVSFALCADEKPSDCATMGKGAMIGVSPSLSAEITNQLIDVAKDKNIPYQLEVMGGETGTDADVIGVTRCGVKSCTVSIPEKYMHTPVEVVSLADVENTASLLAEFLCKDISVEGGAVNA